MDSKYFVVRTRDDAMRIKNYTGQRYYVYDDGKTFSFKRTNKVLEAWELLKNKII